MKTIAQFQPLSSITREEADRHYRAVHTPFARRLLRGMDQVLSYHIARADAEYDIAGGWRQRPRAFRFIVLRFVPGRSLEFPPDVAERIVGDHRLFLRDHRSFTVDEDVLVDRLTGQTALEKYLFEYERPEAMPAGQGAAMFDDMIAALPTDAFGLRLLVSNRVRAEYRGETVDEPGQRPSRTPLAATTKQGFVEFYFDQREWAEEWFARAEVRHALTGGGWALARGYRVREKCGLDRR